MRGRTKRDGIHDSYRRPFSLLSSWFSFPSCSGKDWWRKHREWLCGLGPWIGNTGLSNIHTRGNWPKTFAVATLGSIYLLEILVALDDLSKYLRKHWWLCVSCSFLYQSDMSLTNTWDREWTYVSRHICLIFMSLTWQFIPAKENLTISSCYPSFEVHPVSIPPNKFATLQWFSFTSKLLCLWVLKFSRAPVSLNFRHPQIPSCELSCHHTWRCKSTCRKLGSLRQLGKRSRLLISLTFFNSVEDNSILKFMSENGLPKICSMRHPCNYWKNHGHSSTLRRLASSSWPSDLQHSISLHSPPCAFGKFFFPLGAGPSLLKWLHQLFLWYDLSQRVGRTALEGKCHRLKRSAPYKLNI